MKILITKKLEIEVENLSKLSHKFKFRKDMAVKLLNTIIFGTNNKKNDEENVFFESGWVSLSSKVMQNHTIGKNYAQYLKLFIDHDLIEKRNYLKGSHCNQYRIKEKWLKNYEITSYTIMDNEVIKKTNPRVMLSIKKKYSHLWSFYTSKLLTFNFDTALNELENQDFPLRKKLKHYNTIYKVANGEKWFVKNNKTDKRIHTCLTNLSKIYRKHFKYDGKRLVNVDIKNSQIYFLLALIEGNNKIKDLYNSKKSSIIILEHFSESICQKEFQRFKKLVLSGTFYIELGKKLINEKPVISGWYEKITYDPISKKCNYKYYTYTEAKKLMKSITFEVLFSKNTHHTTEKSWFKRQFPTIYLIIEKIKEEKHNTLALLLQNLESTAILDNTINKIKEFNDDIPLFTIHDSIMTTPEHVNDVKKIFENTLIEFTGLKPSISIE